MSSRFRVIDRQNRRVEKVTHKPLDPPRGIKYVGGVVSWSAPQETRNVTHFRIYKNDEYTLVRQVPLGQTELRERITAYRLFISSYNATTDRESRKVLLGQAINEGYPRSIVFGVPGTAAVGEDVCPHARVAFTGSGKIFRIIRALLNTKDETTSVIKVDMEYSYETECTAYDDRTWTGVFPTTLGDLSLTVGCMSTHDPVTLFSASPLDFYEGTLVRFNVRQTGDRTAVVAQLVGVETEEL